MKKQLITFDLKKINFTAIIMFAVPYAIAETLRFTVFTERLWHVEWWDIILLIAGYVLLLAAPPHDRYVILQRLPRVRGIDRLLDDARE